MELLIGCGSNRDRKICYAGQVEWSDLVTLDMNPDHQPDVVHDLSILPLPFADDSADSISAFDVLEHVGRQGDWRFFFAQWADFWRILKPGGVFMGICPHPLSPWAWADPGHTRIISPDSFVFLDQRNYDLQVGQTAMTDYRMVYRADFDLIHSETDANLQHHFVLQAVKPSRCSLGR